ncbi:MAG TPA: DUF1345 domain-containing protein [Methylocella sp.]|nr:DUF1345 domain-containing protein [Methylocella sp.]
MPNHSPLARWRRRIFRLWLPLRILRGHPRLFIAVAAGAFAEILLPGHLRAATRLLIDWNIGIWLYFVLVAVMMVRASPQSIRRRAKISDEGKFLILVLTTLAAIASIAAIVAELAAVKDLTGTLKGLRMGLAGLTIVSAWSFIHLTFALHYAHEYFDKFENGPGHLAPTRGGLIFPGTEKPDYYDFLYFSYVIGVACQTADVEISSAQMRRTAVIHGVLAFFFNSAVLALTINIAAGLI